MRDDIKEKFKRIVNLKKDLLRDLPRLSKGKRRIKKGVYLGKKVILEPNVFFDTKGGDIVIDQGSKIKAHAVLRGPLYIGKSSIINSFTEISGSKIGDVCRIGGEISGCVVESYSNKNHQGFIGGSYVGSWVNLGGGTSISNMKNTYGKIKMRGQDTGLEHLGAIIGDYVKTSINTSIFCGKVIGQGAHLYGIISEDVPAFTSYFSGQMFEIPLKVSMEIEKRMMGRREVVFDKKEKEKIRKLFKDTAQDRKVVKVKKGKLKFK